MLETNLLVLKSRLSSVEVSWAHDGMELILITSAKDYVQYFIIQFILQKKSCTLYFPYTLSLCCCAKVENYAYISKLSHSQALVRLTRRITSGVL